MYTGIIQDAQFVGPDSYLRRKVEQYQLDKPAQLGPGVAHHPRQPDAGLQAAADVPGDRRRSSSAHLEHPNGWWRDTAQKLLVLRQDNSVAPALRTMAGSSTNQLARIHALWTLEGLGALDARLVRQLLKAADPQIRIQALRASETLYKAGDKSFAADYRALAEDADPGVVIQAMLTMGLQQRAGRGGDRADDGRPGDQPGRPRDRRADPQARRPARTAPLAGRRRRHFHESVGG